MKTVCDDRIRIVFGIARAVTAAVILLTAQTATAGLWTLRVGPPAVGGGGSNPVGLPPSAPDLELNYMTENNWETSLSVVPGVLYGKRFDIGNFYVGLGGGLIISGNGSGFGPYSSFGWESGGRFRFSVEYKQALGITSSGLVSPYALRLGAGFVM